MKPEDPSNLRTPRNVRHSAIPHPALPGRCIGNMRFQEIGLWAERKRKTERGKRKGENGNLKSENGKLRVSESRSKVYFDYAEREQIQDDAVGLKLRVSEGRVKLV